MLNKKLIKNLDFVLIAAMVLLVVFGVVMIASATDMTHGEINRHVRVQVTAFVLGAVVFMIFLCVDYNVVGEFYKLVYALSLVALLLVYVPGLGVVQFGSRRWIDLGVIYVQTSEVAKLGFILSYAKYLESKEGQLNTLRDLIGPVLFISPFLILLMKQPDLGTGLAFVFIALGMLFVSGLNYKIILGGIVSIVVLFPVIYMLMLPHQQVRVDAFLNPNDPALPGNYHVMQSKIALGSGQVTGKGVFKGEYHRQSYLPVQESDFIFSVIGEETGFVGCAAVLSLYFVFLSRMLRISRMAKNRYGSTLVVGVAFMFAFQIFENIGMTMGIMPVTCVTLPFLSYGGSSMLTSMMAVAMVQNVYMRRKRGSFTV